MEQEQARLRVRVGCEFAYRSDADVATLMLVEAHHRADQTVLYQSTWTEPSIPVRGYTDAFGNSCWRLLAPEGPLVIRYDALVEVSAAPDPVRPDAPLTPVADLPDDCLVFTLPSRYIQSDQLITRAWDLFGHTQPSWQRVQAICDWVHQNVRYETGSSNPSVSALDVLERGVGVCRDFALVATAFCRALNIPARYTFGYLPDIAVDPPDVPMDFHAWFEAFVDGRWYAFDARHNRPRVGRVVIGRGRDAVDVAMSTTYGPTQLERLVVWADEVPGPMPDDTNDADQLEAAEQPVA